MSLSTKTRTGVDRLLIRMSDFQACLKAAGFNLAMRRKILSEGQIALQGLEAALRDNLDFELLVDWKSIAAAEEGTLENVLRALFEVLLPGLSSDVATMGTDELGALAADSKKKAFEIAFSQHCKGISIDLDTHPKLTFSLQPTVAYPGTTSLRQFILDTRAGCDNPSEILPSGVGNRQQTDSKSFSVEFSKPPAKISCDRRGWLLCDTATDSHAHSLCSRTWIASGNILSIREVSQKPAITQIALQGGVKYYVHCGAEDVVSAVWSAERTK